MKFHTNIRYAFTALIEIARKKPGETLSLRNIADNIGLPLNYLEQIFLKLRKNDIVESKRGSKGGYEITRKPDEISLYDIYKALDESTIYEHCKLIDLPSSKINLASKCISHNLWASVSKNIEDTLKQVSLKDVNEGASRQIQYKYKMFGENQPEDKKKFIYLDHNSTSPPPKLLWDILSKTTQKAANPSSIHQKGRAARRILEDTRNIIAKYCNAQNANITFTSGGTEANNMLFATANKNLSIKNIVVGASEHASVINAAKKSQIPLNILRCDQNGIYDTQNLEQILSDEKIQKPVLVSLMLANNETGVIQNIKQIASITSKYDAYLHTDASQALGKIPVDFENINCDFMTLCAHKMGAFTGIGALLSKTFLSKEKFIEGGQQEFGRRAGTENIFGIASWKIMLENFAQRQDFPFEKTRKLRDYMEQEILQNISNSQIVASDVKRLPNTTMLIFEGDDSSPMIIGLDMHNIAVSNGSACSAGKVEQSHVLKAMGFSQKQMSSAIRVSLGPDNDKQEIEKFLAVVTEISARKHKGKINGKINKISQQQNRDIY